MSIEFHGVTKLYGDVIGVNDVDLSLSAGAYGLLGPNGSGKSTLLNLITGQLRPSLGRVEVFGRCPFGSMAARRELGYCPESDVLASGMSGLEFVGTLLELHGYRRPEARELAAKTLSELGLGEAMTRSMSTYSRGMRQRAKLAQALAHTPRLLILDEPLNGLDPVGRHEVSELLRRYCEGGGTMILASHVLHEVQAVTDRFVLIAGGRVLASGQVAEIRELLAEVPHTIELECSDPRALIQALLAAELLDGVELLAERSGARLTTRRPAELYRRLPGLIVDSGVVVNALSSPDDDLDTLFEYLIARG